MRAGKKTVAMVLAGLLSLSAVCPAFAAEKPEGMDDATWIRLQDGKIEYDEIENLVAYFNPTYLSALGQIDAALGTESTERSISEMKAEIKNIKDDAEAAKDNNDMFLYMYNTALADALEKQSLGAMNLVIKMANSMKKEVYRKGDAFWSAKRKLTFATQQLMIGYNMALTSKELIDTSVELANAAYQSTITQRNLGMATDTSVENAEKALVSARKQQQSLNDNLTGLRQNLSIMIGGSYDTLIEVGTIPTPDLSRIDTMNPDQDVYKAIPYDQSVQDDIHEDERSQAKYELKYLSLEESKGELKSRLESIYQKVLESKTSYEAAQTALESATITMNGNDLKFQMGMLGQLEYLQAKVGYLQQKMTYDMAVLSLYQAINNYEWALYGIYSN